MRIEKSSTDEDSNRPRNRKEGIDLSLEFASESTISEDDYADSFIQSSMKYFWECKHCNSIPFPWRASGSVVFSCSTPSSSATKKHLKVCRGKNALRVPRIADISLSFENSTSIRIQWDSSNCLRKSERIDQRRKNQNLSKTTTSLQPLAYHLNSLESLEGKKLIFPEDQILTTEFAFFTISQLKMTRLTKTGGSRGACPLGYPGLACRHCTDELNERKFFYTSADHLRNSFSHIPSHLMDCSKCPEKVKTALETFKLLRNKQKSQLELGSHKIFIDRVWARMHGDPNEESDDEETFCETPESSDETTLISEEEVDSVETKSSNDDEQESSCKINNVLVRPNDEALTSNFVYFALQQFQPYLCTKSDAVKEKTVEIGFPGLICRHCCSEDNSFKIFYRSSEHLRNNFVTLPNHLTICASCPEELKEQLNLLNRSQAEEEANLKRSALMSFIDRVWGRLIMLDKSRKPTVPRFVPDSRILVFPEDKNLVTDFTYFTLQQMIPCHLTASGNGARSMFEVGFPGLACVHCAGSPTARKFFYRTSEILGGNYAHIPNHLMACKHCPLNIKSSLDAKKEYHAAQKSKLSRGSQRTFFSRIWTRLHGANDAVRETTVNL